MNKLKTLGSNKNKKRFQIDENALTENTKNFKKSEIEKKSKKNS